MTDNPRRRVHGAHSVFHDPATGKYRAQATIGFSPSGARRYLTRSGTSESQALKRLKAALREREAGHTRNTERYTVGQAVTDWLTVGLVDRSPATLEKSQGFARVHIIPKLGKRRIKDLTVADVQAWLTTLAKDLAKDSMIEGLAVLRRSIDHAVACELAVRNVTHYVKVPAGQEGRPSKSFTIEQVNAICAHPMQPHMRAYILLSLFTGIRTEEARALTWADLHLPTGNGAAYVRVTKATRHGGDTKTRGSKRAVEIPAFVANVLKAWQRTSPHNQPVDLVFVTANGTAYDASGLRKRFRHAITGIDGINPADWTPRELRHTFVSLMSDSGVPAEQIAQLVGHSSTAVTETVYRHQLQPVLRTGSDVLNTRFAAHAHAANETAGEAE